MKLLIATILSFIGAAGLLIGKYGTILSILAWAAGLIGLVNPVSFGWVLVFASSFILGLLSATTAAVIVKG
jgi:hypothetical protein